MRDLKNKKKHAHEKGKVGPGRELWAECFRFSIYSFSILSNSFCRWISRTLQLERTHAMTHRDETLPVPFADARDAIVTLFSSFHPFSDSFSLAFFVFLFVSGIFTGCWGRILCPGEAQEWNKKLKKVNGRKFSRWLDLRASNTGLWPSKWIFVYNKKDENLFGLFVRRADARENKYTTVGDGKKRMNK